MNEIINFGDGKSVKVMLLKGEAGNNIQSIDLTSTSGLVDTYTITLTDGTTTNFQVTNGSNIQSIDKTGTSGLVDTYTVTLTNGNTTTFQVTNGEYDVPSSQGRNLAIYPYFRPNTYTHNGITYYVNADGSITCNGTATASSFYAISTRGLSNGLILERGKKYTLSGCPNGGTSTTYHLFLTINTVSGGSTTRNIIDYGEGATFTFENTYPLDGIGFSITIKEGTTVNGLTFKPMLEVGTIAHAYEPTTETALSMRTAFASVEDGDTASQSLYMNDYIMRKNDLWRLDHNIASGATITEGSDIIKTNVGAELNKRLEVVNIDVQGNDGQTYSVTVALKDLAFQVSLLLQGQRYIYGTLLNGSENYGPYHAIANNLPNGIVELFVITDVLYSFPEMYQVYKNGLTYRIYTVSMDEVIIN